jgi:hypothetical protein
MVALEKGPWKFAEPPEPDSVFLQKHCRKLFVVAKTAVRALAQSDSYSSIEAGRSCPLLWIEGWRQERRDRQVMFPWLQRALWDLSVGLLVRLWQVRWCALHRQRVGPESWWLPRLGDITIQSKIFRG